MKRRMMSLMIALVIALMSVPFVSGAAEKTVVDFENSDFEFVLHEESTEEFDGTAEIKKYTGEATETDAAGHEYILNIPEIVEKDGKQYSVTSIGEHAFENNRYITEVNMPESITKIGKNAFNCCTNIMAVTMYEGLNEIGENAFFSCTRLKSVIVKSVEETPSDEESTDITSASDGTVEEPAEEGAKETSDGTESDVSENIVTTEKNVVTLPASLEKLGAGAFYDCQNIRKLKVLGDLNEEDSVGDYAFGCCNKLESAEFEYAPYEISRQMFMSCHVLEDITLLKNPENTVSIGDNAFANCIKLKSFGEEAEKNDGGLDIPNNVTYIGSRAFYNCISTETAEVPNCVIGDMAFDSCTELKELTFTEAEESPIESKADESYIGDEAFGGTIIDDMKLPAYLDKFEDGAFVGSNISKFYVHEDNPHFSADEEGVLYNKAGDELMAYPVGKEDETYNVSNNVKTISDKAFMRCEFKNITLPSSLEKIEAYAFAGCYELVDISIPDSVTEIGKGAFSDCEALASVELSDEIDVINEGLFNNCPGIKKINIPEDVTQIGARAFGSCYSLSSVNIPAGVVGISEQAFVSCPMLKTLDISSDNESFIVKDGVLYNKDKTKLISVLSGKSGETFVVPNSVTEIGTHAFSGNSKIKTVKIGDNVKTFGNKAAGYYIIFDDSYIDRTDGFCIVISEENDKAKEYAAENDIAYFTGEPKASKSKITLKAGETSKFTINNSVEGSVLYTSSDESIVKVDRRTGELTGVSKGETAVVASIGTLNYICDVTVTSGAKPAIEGTEYKMITNVITEWEKNYKEYNKGKSLNPLDNTNLIEYTSNNYIAILAKTQSTPKSPKYIIRSDASIGEGCYEQYSNIASNLSLEMSRFALNENIVLYRGTDDLSQYTKAGTSKLDDMYASIGEQVKTGNKGNETRYSGDWVASTSVNHGVSFYFGSGSTRTVLEIYAPKDFTRGAYLDTFSVFEGENEILLDGGTTFEVIDAGVRQVELPGYGEPIEELERYMKLQIVGVKSENGDVTGDFGTPTVVELPASDAPVAEGSYTLKRVDEFDFTELKYEGIESEQEIKSRFHDNLFQILGDEFNIENTEISEMILVDENENEVNIYEVSQRGLEVTIPYPEEVKKNWKDYDYTILHMYDESTRSRNAGDIEGPIEYEKTKDGLKVVLYSMSPFAIHWSDADDTDSDVNDAGGGSNAGSDTSADTGDDTPIMPLMIILLFSFVIAVLALTVKRAARK